MTGSLGTHPLQENLKKVDHAFWDKMSKEKAFLKMDDSDQLFKGKESFSFFFSGPKRFLRKSAF